MTLVLVTGSLEAGGAERQLSDMGNYWARQGYHVTVATWSSSRSRDFYALEPNISRVTLEVDPDSRALLARFRARVAQIRKFRALLRRVRPDAVLSFIDVSNVLTLLASRGLGVRVVISERTSPAVNPHVSGLWRALRRLCYSWAQAVVAQTSDAARWLDGECSVRALVIPNALRALPFIERQRESLIIAVGRLSAEKGFDLLIRAFARIGREFPGWRLVILGEGPERSALEELRSELQLAQRVELLGRVEDIEVWMARAGLLVHPSRREGFPNVVLEAMGMGVAVICANCRSGPSELIRDGINGRLVPVDDLDALTLTMQELIARPDLRDRLGREAVKVREDYAPSHILEKWEACLLPRHAVR